MKKPHIHTIEWVTHISLILLGWCTINFLVGDVRFGMFQTGNGAFIWPSAYGTLLNAALFYGNTFWPIPQVWRRKGVGSYILALLLLFMGVNAVESLADEGILRYREVVVNEAAQIEIVVLVVLTHILTLLVSFAYRFSKDWFYNERIKQEMIATNLQTELDFLRSQVSPHFLFNTLNNLFAMAIKNDDDETAEGIGRLSGLMRYMLYDSNKSSITLQQEIDYLQDYIELQKLRVQGRNDVELQLQVEGNISQHQLSPMLFIPFIENAFKYGLSPSQPVAIAFHFAMYNQELIFESRNTINRQHKPSDKHASGIGLENVKRRLSLLYPQKHELYIGEEEDEFVVKLKLVLNDT